jgi:hypothetical protein
MLLYCDHCSVRRTLEPGIASDSSMPFSEETYWCRCGQLIPFVGDLSCHVYQTLSTFCISVLCVIFRRCLIANLNLGSSISGVFFLRITPFQVFLFSKSEVELHFSKSEVELHIWESRWPVAFFFFWIGQHRTQDTYQLHGKLVTCLQILFLIQLI